MSKNRIPGYATTVTALPATGTYNEGTADDILYVAPTMAAGTVTLNMNGDAVAPVPGTTPADGDTLTIDDPSGVLSGTKKLLVQGNGRNIFIGAAAVASFTLSTPGANVTLTFSSALNAWIAYGEALTSTQQQVSARGASTTGNLALTGIPAAQDGITYVAGDTIWLWQQTNKAQNGPWVVSAGAWSRPAYFASGAVLPAGFRIQLGPEGTLFGMSEWKVNLAGVLTVDTSTFDSFPGRVVQQIVLVAGTVTVTNVPILSTTKTAFQFTRTTPNTTAATIAYNPSAITAGTTLASVTFQAQVAAGTINNADISTGNLAIINW